MHMQRRITQAGLATVVVAALTACGGHHQASNSVTPQAAPTANNVLATAPAALTGAVGSSTGVTLTFATDDGGAASALTLDAASLPAGWTLADPAAR